jgi:hypothetical protein
VAKLPRCITKRFRPPISRTSQDGFPPRPLANAAVSKSGSSRGCDQPDGRASKRTNLAEGAREHSRKLFEAWAYA